MTIDHIALIGFGEVGQIIGRDLPATGVSDLAAWDIKFPETDSAPSRALKKSDVRGAQSAPDAAAGADLIICAVTAEQALSAAKAAAPGLKNGAFYLDMNSTSPTVKKEAAHLIEEAGGRFVEAAVISPFPPKRLAAPILLGGPHGAAFLDAGAPLGFTGATFFSEEVGKASAAKMCRSVMIQGMEALLMEALLTARRCGVEETVIDSLSDLFPGPDWRALARYMISRSLIHGARRAEEMREAACTVEEAGIAPWMSEGAARRQDWAAHFTGAVNQADLNDMLDTILSALEFPEETALK